VTAASFSLFLDQQVVMRVAPGLEIFGQGLVERRDGGWRITDVGRSALELMESKPAAPELPPAQIATPEPSPAITPPASLVVAGPNRRLDRRRRRRRPTRQRQMASACMRVYGWPGCRRANVGFRSIASL
jgi:hypothetical protein